jgi:hypothetical protein
MIGSLDSALRLIGKVGSLGSEIAFSRRRAYPATAMVGRWSPTRVRLSAEWRDDRVTASDSATPIREYVRASGANSVRLLLAACCTVLGTSDVRPWHRLDAHRSSHKGKRRSNRNELSAICNCALHDYSGKPSSRQASESAVSTAGCKAR